MSRSCQSATFSIAGIAMPRTRRASPVTFSVSTGLRLCGIAEEPFWPSEKNSSASSTSVRCRWRISIASRSRQEATTPSVAKNMAWRSRGMTCVETGSDGEPHLGRHVRLDARIDVGEGADRAGDRAGRHLLAGGDKALAAARELGIGLRQLEPEGDRLGVDAVRAADRPASACARARASFSAASSASTSAIRMSEARASCTARQVSSTSDEVMPWCTKRASGPMNSARWVRKAMTSCFVTALDLVDARDVEGHVPRLGPDGLRARACGITPRSARASQACASISNQMRNRVCGSHTSTMAGRE